MALLKLSKTNVDNLPYSLYVGKQVFYYDTDLKGFGIRISNKTKSYFVETKINGKTVRVTIGKHGIITAEQARKIAKQTLATMSQGINPNAVYKENQIKAITLKEAYEDYLASRPSLKATTKKDYKTCAELYLKDWLHKPLLEITRDMVEQKHKALSQTSGARANLAMRFLRAVFNFAAEYRDAAGKVIIADNPVKRLSAKKIWNKIERRKNYIQPHQLKAWWDAVWTLKADPKNKTTKDRESIRDYLLLLLFCGLRREEALALRWHPNIDFQTKTLKLFDTKNRMDHVLPMSGFVFDMLLRRRASSNSEWVFPGSGKTGRIIEPRKQILRIVELSGVQFSSHDLRRTFASYVNMLSHSISHYTVKRLLNHKTADITADYIQHDIEKLRDDMQAITNFILGHVTLSREAPINKVEVVT